jgi:hypothetical protein
MLQARRQVVNTRILLGSSAAYAAFAAAFTIVFFHSPVPPRASKE